MLTGVGKSILVDALAMLLGDKASSDVIRKGAERVVVATGGKGRVFMNNQPATVAVLRLLAPHLATHAQNESILNFNGPARLGSLDSFAGSQPDAVEIVFTAWKEIRNAH